MPQMSPYNWIFLNLYFIIIILIIFCYIQFFYMNKPLNKNNKLLKLLNFKNKW